MRRQLQLSDVAAGGGPLDGARIVHERTGELLTVQHTVSDEQAISVEGASTPSL